MFLTTSFAQAARLGKRIPEKRYALGIRPAHIFFRVYHGRVVGSCNFYGSVFAGVETPAQYI